MKSSIITRNINEIPIIEIVNDDLRNKKVPLIVLYHGWQSQKELMITQARRLAKKEFRVVIADALNHGRRKAPVSKVPSLTFWQTIQSNIAEFDLILNYYERIKLLDREKIGVGGYSMGGFTTSAIFTIHPEVKVAANIMGSSTPWQYAMRIRDFSQLRGFYYPPNLPLLLSWIGNIDLSSHPERIAGRPYMIWHGTMDPRVPYDQIHDFYENIKDEEYAKNTVFITGEGEGHLVTIENMERIADFFEKNM